MEVLAVIVFVVGFVAYALLDTLEDGEAEERDPLALARPSIEQLDAEAERALEELRQLGHEEGEE